jgi:predicted ATPase
MIKEIIIEGFKKFSSQKFEATPLTILTGKNGGGKTSLVHALLLMREIVKRNNTIVELNGPYDLELGTLDDIENSDAPEQIRFSVVDDDSTIYSWELNGEPSALFANIRPAQDSFPPVFSNGGRVFQYLSAERFGPRSILGSAALPLELIDVGHRGQFSAQLLYALSSFKVVESRKCPDNSSNDASLLKFETEKWLSRIARTVQIDSEVFPGTTVTALRFRGEDGTWVRPPNMGFGVTYALPVVLAGLTAEEGGMLIVENPEAHLHPAGQSEMGRFLATVAASGVQVIIETHSDHVLNGVRRAIGEHGVLKTDAAIVHYFSTDPLVTSLRFTSTGGIEAWPVGFFDQFQVDVTALTRIRRGKPTMSNESK